MPDLRWKEVVVVVVVFIGLVVATRIADCQGHGNVNPS